jgi:DNA-binding XRE family transcriptional regulator
VTFYLGIFYFGIYICSVQAVAPNKQRPAMEKTIYTREYGVMLKVLREMRERMSLTQNGLASRLDVTQVFISKCESGQRRLDLIELRAWCAAMDVSTSDFLKAVEEEIANTHMHMHNSAPG